MILAQSRGSTKTDIFHDMHWLSFDENVSLSHRLADLQDRLQFGTNFDIIFNLNLHVV